MIHLPKVLPKRTSFHGHTILASPNEMIEILGEPDYLNGDKTNMEWVRELDSADVFTIYDWKNYGGISNTEEIEWHIGAMNGFISEEAKKEIESLLNKNKKNNMYA